MSNLIWCKSRQWQDWINEQDIELGQPMLKNDKSSAMLELEERCEFITFAHPKLRGFDPEKRRYYLPVSLNQVLDFFVSTTDHAVSVTQYKDVSIQHNMKTYKGKTWLEACTKLLREVCK